MKLTHAASLLALVLSVAATPALAQQAQSTPIGQETTATLNREQAEKARQQLAGNAASRQAHDHALRKHEEFEAEKARLAAEHEAAMTSWRADVDACNAGDQSRCAQPAPVQ